MKYKKSELNWAAPHQIIHHTHDIKFNEEKVRNRTPTRKKWLLEDQKKHSKYGFLEEMSVYGSYAYLLASKRTVDEGDSRELWIPLNTVKIYVCIYIYI